ncbi:MAG: protein kinase domain-containing protein [Halothece sp.]
MSITCPTCLTENTDTTINCVGCGTPLQANNNTQIAANFTYQLPPNTYLKNQKYVIEKTLGEGGFGITYRGKDCQTSKTIAIKELWPEKALRQNTTITWPHSITPEEKKQQLLKFQLEAKYQAQCQHPNICQVYDWFEENNTAYIVMDFIPGKSLYQLLQEQKTLPEEKVKKYFIEVAEALAIIHNNNFLHRDIKPDNILIDGNDQAIIIDFGATKEFLAGQTREMSITLTAGYAPLEQYSYKSKRWPATDIYALCASMYELVTGQLPEAAFERLNASNADTLTAPRQLAPHLSPLLERVILTGMNLKVENRFQNAQELVDALKGNFVSPLHNKARKCVENQQLAEAVQTYEQCLKSEPDNENVAIELALVQIYLDDQKAEEAANQALKLNSQEGRMYGIIGLVYCRRGHWKKAEQTLQKATQLSPREGWIKSNLAWAFGKQNKWEEAEATINQALNIIPHCPFSLGLQSWIATQRKQWKIAIKGARQALFKCKENTSESAFMLKKWVYPCLLVALDHAVVTQQAQDVERCLEKYLKEIPHSGFALGFQGWRQSREGISSAVLQSFQQAIKLDSSSYWMLINLGITQEQLQATSEAIETYKQGVKQFPNDPIFQLRLGTNFAKSEQWEAAISHLEKSLNLDNHLAMTHHNLAWSLLNTMKANQGEAQYYKIIERYQSAIALYQKQSRQDLASQLEQSFLDIGIQINQV